MREVLKPCPFCGGKATIICCDDEGNIHGDDYENNQWSGLGYQIRHSHEENEDCPIARYAEDGAIMGGVYIYDTREEAIEAWNRRTNDAEVHSADVQEVKHARWIPDDKAYIWRCSECEHFTNERIVKWYRDIEGNVCYRSDQPPFYCSRCGAKMNLEEKGK